MSQILPFDPFHIVVMCLCIAEWRIKNDMLHNFDKFLGILAINHYVIWIKMWHHDDCRKWIIMQIWAKLSDKVTQDYECVVSLMNLLFLPHLTGRQRNMVKLMPGWSARRRGCLKGKTAHANPLLSPWDSHLRSWAACCPGPDMSLVRARSICTLCNKFHLSSSRSDTAR